MGKLEKNKRRRILYRPKNTRPYFIIHRVVSEGMLPNSIEARILFASYSIKVACDNVKRRANVIQTPGGFIWCRTSFDNIHTGKSSEKAGFEGVITKIRPTVEQFLTGELKEMLRKKTNNLTLGIDVFDLSADKNQGKHAELVGTFNTIEDRFTGWTGKSSPVQDQTSTLLYCIDHDSHFQRIDGVDVLVLGCHDLNIFSPRSRESIKPTTYKGKLISEMQRRCDEIKPVVLLQHPHSTDSSRIWSVAWSGVKRFIPSIQIYSGAVHYANFKGGAPREPLEKVLASTASPFVKNTRV